MIFYIIRTIPCHVPSPMTGIFNPLLRVTVGTTLVILEQKNLGMTINNDFLQKCYQKKKNIHNSINLYSLFVLN